VAELFHAQAGTQPWKTFVAFSRVALEVSRNDIVALSETQARQQSLCWTPSSVVTDKPGQFSGPASSPREGSCALGEPIGESPPLTSSIPTLL